ncbi:MAG: FHA domain-containing protein [Pyrinomonadaceae bacterium]
MNITLSEERAGAEFSPEQSFAKPVILIGRDAFECDIAFNNELHPMVSRRHAELRVQDGRWVLIDLDSSYGVYLNGQKISSPQAVQLGAAIQFGTDGPMLRIVGLEAASEVPKQVVALIPEKPAQPNVAESAWDVEPARGYVPKSISTSPVVELARLDFTDGARPSFTLSAKSTWFGREPECSIVFQSNDVTVSRKHAEIRLENGNYFLEDNNSFNGTLVNEQRISSVTPLYHNDEIRLGVGGPVLRFNSPSRTAPAGAGLTGQRALPSSQIAAIPAEPDRADPKTVVFQADKAGKYLPDKTSGLPQLLMSVTFGGKKELTIGRDEKNDISLDGLQISKCHARLLLNGSEIFIEDLNSTNGVFVNGNRISRQAIQPNDEVQIGTFMLQANAAGNIGVYDTRSKTRIDAVNITREVTNRVGGGKIKLLDSISLSIQPNEFIGFLGPSGAGKSTLMEAMNGMRPASGNVLVNNLDLYRHLDSLKQSIGYVPQDDIIHRELSVYRTLYYVAKLRLSRDVSGTEIRQIVDEVLDVTGLAERRNVPVNQLSGGQRKRVSIAVELITKPSIIFLDEPTSGLDPAVEERIMKLFRQIAESGRTVILTTHAMENVKLFDKIVVLMAGKLVFYGKPDDALKHLQASSFKDLYARLEQPVEDGVREHGESNRRRLTEQTAEQWKQKFFATPQFVSNIYEPLKELGQLQPSAVRKKRRLGIFGSLSQWLTLSRRYLEVLFKDKLTLFILFAQAPIIALLTFYVMGPNQPRDFAYFVLALVAFWFGTSVSAREIIREQPVYRRERMVNLGILPYLASKLFVLGIIVGLQCLMLFVPLKLFDLIGIMPMPGEFGGVPQLWTMFLTASVGIALGLLISALVRTSEMATSLIPLILIPQILFSGIVGVPAGINKVVGLTMPAAWSFDTMKRFSTLDTLEDEGANPRGKTKGLGLYKFVETENDKTIAKAEKDFEEYRKQIGAQFQDAPAAAEDKPAKTNRIGKVEKIPEDLSGYISFLHPSMNEVLNQIVLILMFGMLVIATIIIMRLKDII